MDSCGNSWEFLDFTGWRSRSGCVLVQLNCWSWWTSDVPQWNSPRHLRQFLKFYTYSILTVTIIYLEKRDVFSLCFCIRLLIVHNCSAYWFRGGICLNQYNEDTNMYCQCYETDLASTAWSSSSFLLSCIFISSIWAWSSAIWSCRSVVSASSLRLAFSSSCRVFSSFFKRSTQAKKKKTVHNQNPKTTSSLKEVFLENSPGAWKVKWAIPKASDDLQYDTFQKNNLSW